MFLVLMVILLRFGSLLVMGLWLGLVSNLCKCLIKMVSVLVVRVAGLGKRMSPGEDLIWLIL